MDTISQIGHLQDLSIPPLNNSAYTVWQVENYIVHGLFIQWIQRSVAGIYFLLLLRKYGTQLKRCILILEMHLKFLKLVPNSKKSSKVITLYPIFFEHTRPMART